MQTLEPSKPLWRVGLVELTWSEKIYKDTARHYIPEENNWVIEGREKPLGK